MDLRQHLKGLSRPVLVEVVYLAGRYLTHGLTKDVFLRQLNSDVKINHRDKSAGVVLEIMAEIEADEGKAVRELAMVKRFALAGELDDMLWEEISPQTDDAKVEDALAALRTRAEK